MTRDELGLCLGARIAEGYCWVCEGLVEIFENIVGAEGLVACTLPSAGVGLIFQLDKVGFPFLRQQKTVDWLLLVHLPDGSIDAHLVEFKTTVGLTTWRDVKEKMASSVTRARALVGALGVALRDVHCYTAFRNAKLSVPVARNPALTRGLIGSEDVVRAERADTRTARAVQLDWEAPEISIDGVDTPVLHRRIQLDPTTGVGQTVLFSR
jgi:hypothetical protein